MTSFPAICSARAAARESRALFSEHYRVIVVTTIIHHVSVETEIVSKPLLSSLISGRLVNGVVVVPERGH